jgi:hypothetical protein
MFDSNTKNSDQFAISYELLTLLQWIATNERPQLKKMIQHSLASGLKKSLKDKNSTLEHVEIEHSPHYAIIEFFSLLEKILLESINEQTVQKAVEKNLMSAIDHIDSTVCDDATVRFSIEKAALKLKKSPNENPEEILFKELLKRWKPTKK